MLLETFLLIAVLFSNVVQGLMPLLDLVWTTIESRSAAKHVTLRNEERGRRGLFQRNQALCFSSTDGSEKNTSVVEGPVEEQHASPSNLPLMVHHTALKTRNIDMAIQFYSLLGFEVVERFRAGPAKAAWLSQSGQASTRIELIEVPNYLLNEPEGMKRRAMDLMQHQYLLGLNHFALDVTPIIESDSNLSSLQDWIDHLNEKSVELFGKTLRIALAPQQQLIGSGVYELAFLYDADGSLIEVLNKQNDLPQQIDSGWEPWDGTGFLGGEGNA